MEAWQHFFQMDFLRHTFEGRLTEYLWTLPLDSDLYYRAVFMGRDGRSVFDAIEESLDEETAGLIQAYADGINAWLEDQRANYPSPDWPTEYKFLLLTPFDVPDWEVRDTIAIARYQTWDLSQTLDYELDLTSYAETLDSDFYAQVFSRAMATDTTVLPPGKGVGAPPVTHPYVSALPPGYQGLDRARAFIHRAKRFYQLAHLGKASNNWIVSPSINNGVGYLCNDPHLDLTYPSIFMLGYIDDKELGGGDTRNWGSMFPGTPAVVIGANENLAWGETVAGYDVTDVYAERLVLDGETPKAVVYDGHQVPLIKATQTFKIRWFETPEKRDLYVVPHHGPILPDSIDGDAAMSFRWTGHDPTYEIRAILKLREAANVDEAFDAIADFAVGAQNFVLQDTAGDIGYDPHASAPIRDWDLETHRPWHVLPGDGSAEWNGFVPEAKLPQAVNPERGFLLTANNDINGSAQSGDPTTGEYYWYFSTDIGYRAQRIDQMLSALAAGDGFDAAAMMATQFDARSNWANDLLPMVEEALAGDLGGLSDDAKSLLQYWGDWQYVLDSGIDGADPNGPAAADAGARANAVAAMAFGQFETRLREAAFADEFAAAGVDYPYGWDEQLVALKSLAADDPLWNDVSTPAKTETRRDIVVKALNTTATDLAARAEFADKPIDQWLWGRVHNLALGHIAFAELGLHFGDLGPFAIPGGIHTVNVAGYAQDGQDYTVSNGPSLRIIHEFADGKIVTRVHYPGGQIPNFTSPHQQDMLKLYLAGEYYEMPHEVQAILSQTTYMIAFE
jgi:penicillin amidase